MNDDLELDKVEIDAYHRQITNPVGKTPKQSSTRKMFATDNRSSFNSNSKLKSSYNRNY